MHTDIVLLWPTQPTDWFGGASANVPLPDGIVSKVVPVTVVDTRTPFVDCCQELGHSYGFQHELDRAGNEYASPYSVMSSRTNTAEFARPFDPRLPDGDTIKDPTDPMVGQPAQRVVGAAPTGAQLYAWPDFRDSPSVITLRRDPARRPQVVRLYARDYQLRQPPGPLPVLLAVPSHRGDGWMFFVELRRGRGFDSALGRPGKVPEGLVVHSGNPDGRIRYDGVAPLTLVGTQTDWASEEGDFALRYRYLDPAHEYADVEVRAGGHLSFPIRGVLLAGGFRSQAELTAMSHDDMRNTLIVELTGGSNQRDFQAYDDARLEGAGAVLVAMRELGVRSDDALRKMSVDDMRNTLIVELDAQTHLGSRLQGLDDLELALVPLGIEPPG